MEYMEGGDRKVTRGNSESPQRDTPAAARFSFIFHLNNLN